MARVVRGGDVRTNTSWRPGVHVPRYANAAIPHHLGICKEEEIPSLLLFSVASWGQVNLPPH